MASEKTPLPAAAISPYVLEPIASHLGFAFDPAKFPFTLLENLTAIAAEIRESGLDKTGGKNSSDPKIKADAKYAYFEEAEIAAKLVTLLNKHKIGYAAGSPKITGRFENSKTNSGGTMWLHHVTSSVLFSHKESGEWLVVPGVGAAADAGDKGLTKAITSAIKYIWMKTFLISDGNDIELDQGQNQNGKQQQATQSKSRTAKPKLECHQCRKEIVDTKSRDGSKIIPAQVIADKTTERFGMKLCSSCALAKGEKKASKPQERSQEPEQAQESENGNQTQILSTTLASATKRMIAVKGKKKPVYDLVLHGGVKVTDWHASHYELYEDTRKGDHIKLRFEVKQNGKYTNRDLLALMELKDEVLEDEDGNDVSGSEAENENQGSQPAWSENWEASNDDIPF